MSDPNETTTPTEPEAPEQRDADTEPLGDAGKKALQELRERARAAEEALAEFGGLSKGEVRKFISEAKANEKRLKQLGEERMSDLEKAQAAAKEAQDAAAKATTEALRWKVAAEFAIAAEDAEVFLTGTDEDSIRKQAQRLAELATAKGPTTPKPDLSQGAKGTPSQATPAQKFAAAFEGRL